ncbi:hypothetical protein C3K47_16300 [Solitalea longa]|uniref:Lipoprotein n=1 Tax=Solitalea longa TaxID=2079460 RepID=A0A2S4ZZ57_9SPHI|nr:hypothetical protein [Solitalea longa]POY35143.1 hypothetical protein C3K47_16300 [Solitalea longa]
MKIHYLYFILVLLFFFGCNNRPKQTSTLAVADTVSISFSQFYGNWLCKDYMDEMYIKRNSEYYHSINKYPPFLELIISEDLKDSVLVLNYEKKIKKVPIKVVGLDTLLVYQNSNQPLVFVYDKFTQHLSLKTSDSKNPKKDRPDCIFEKSEAKYLQSGEDVSSTFDWAINENTLSNTYAKAEDSTRSNIVFHYDGTLSGLDEFEKFNVCAVNCIELANKAHKNILYLATKNESTPFAWKISGNYDTLFIYSLKKTNHLYSVNQLKYKLIVAKNN